MNEIIELLKRHPLFVGASASELMRLAEFSKFKHLDKKQDLFVQGDPCQAFYIVKSGMIKLIRVGVGGREAVVRFVGPGEGFAEAVIFDMAPYPVTARACVDSQILEVSAAPTIEVIKSSWNMVAAALSHFLVRFKEHVERIEYLGINDSRLRFAYFYLREASAPTAMSDGQMATVLQNMTRKEIASHLGMTPETFSRHFGELKNKKILSELDKNHVLINVNLLTSYILSFSDEAEP